MFYSPKLYMQDRFIWVPLVISLVCQGFLWWYCATNIHAGTEQIFLHYNIIFGVDLVGQWWNIFFLPLAGLIIILINYFFSFFIYGKEKFLSRLLSFWTIFFHIFLLLATVFLVRLNI